MVPFLGPSRADGINTYTAIEPPKPELSIFDWLGVCCSEQPSRNLDYRLRQREEIIIGQLQQEVLVSFDPGALEHEAFLQEYFKAAAPALSPLEKNRSLIEKLPEGRRDHRWKELGFQDEDPRTDFRGGGLLSLKCLLHMTEHDSKRVCQLIRESSGAGQKDEGTFYPFAAAVINVCFRLAGWLMLDLRRARQVKAEDVCTGFEYRRFAELTVLEPETFLLLATSAVVAVHEEWRTNLYSVLQFSRCVDAAMKRVSLQTKHWHAYVTRGHCRSLLQRRRYEAFPWPFRSDWQDLPILH
eukprot:s180_g13.t1